jgi:kynurenine formamidase
MDENGKRRNYVNERRPNNWGRWGDFDERGTANYIDAAAVVRAAQLIKSGRVISCAIDIDPRTTPVPPDRAGIAHLYQYTGTDFIAADNSGRELPAFSGTDDYCFMALQTGTHWDALAHSHHDQTIYNGFSIATISAYMGARKGSIHRLQAALVGRGVLLDLPRVAGVARLEPGHAITPAELDEAARALHVEIQSGDILLVRTGHLAWYYTLEDRSEFWRAGSPGMSMEVVAWLHRSEVAALAMDNVGIEVAPHEDPSAGPYPMHSRLLRDLGLTIGELWGLEDLAGACAEDGRYEFFLSAPPLAFVNASGSPINPIVIK